VDVRNDQGFVKSRKLQELENLSNSVVGKYDCLCMWVFVPRPLNDFSKALMPKIVYTSCMHLCIHAYRGKKFIHHN
jgi:hypothetical protein